MQINKTGSRVSAQNGRQATEQIHTVRKHPDRACEHVGDSSTNMDTENAQDQYGVDEYERDLPCPGIRILPARSLAHTTTPPQEGWGPNRAVSRRVG